MFREEGPPAAQLGLQGPESFVQQVRLSLAFDLQGPALRRTDQIVPRVLMFVLEELETVGTEVADIDPVTALRGSPIALTASTPYKLSRLSRSLLAATLSPTGLSTHLCSCWQTSPIKLEDGSMGDAGKIHQGQGGPIRSGIVEFVGQRTAWVFADAHRSIDPAALFVASRRVDSAPPVRSRPRK